jgi:hypothetical protein
LSFGKEFNMATPKKKIVKEVKKVTDEEKILGATDEIVTVEVVAYDSPDAKYKVTNYRNGKREIEVSGRNIEAFIGLNSDARDALKHGEKSVTVYNLRSQDKEILYTIEVL